MGYFCSPRKKGSYGHLLITGRGAHLVKVGWSTTLMVWNLYPRIVSDMPGRRISKCYPISTIYSGWVLSPSHTKKTTSKGGLKPNLLTNVCGKRSGIPNFKGSLATIYYNPYMLHGTRICTSVYVGILMTQSHGGSMTPHKNFREMIWIQIYEKYLQWVF